MGLGEVAIATLPSVIFPKLMFSDGLGGVKEILCIFLQTKIIPTNDLLTLNYFYHKLIKTTKVCQRI